MWHIKEKDRKNNHRFTGLKETGLIGSLIYQIIIEPRNSMIKELKLSDQLELASTKGWKGKETEHW